MAIWVKALLYMLLVGGAHFVALPSFVLFVERGRLVAAPSYRRYPAPLFGAIMFAVGAGMALLAACYLVARGRGTPFPLDPTHSLVTTGPYRYVRNPQAIAATLMIVGEVVAIRSRWLWTLFPLTILYLEGLAAPIEDRQLSRKFGSHYFSYRRSVRKWLPGWRRMGSRWKDQDRGYGALDAP